MAQFKNLMDRWSGWSSTQDAWRPYWQQLGDVLLPNRADFTRQQMPGQSRELGIYDGTPRLALRNLSSTLDGLIKPATSNWFQPGCDDEKIAKNDEAKLWFEVVRDRMWRAIYNKNARFIQRSGEVDTDLACFGWGALWMQENRLKNGMMFRSFPIGNVVFDENEEGVIDCFAVEERMKARQLAGLYDRLGKPQPKAVTEALAPGSLKANSLFPVVQMVLPIHDSDASDIAAPRHMEFASAVIDTTSESVISEMGFAEFPAAIPRWDTSSGEIYPRSPGMMALPDARTLQAMGKTLLTGGQRAVDPPVWVQNDAVLSPLRTFPGGITVLDFSDTQGSAPIGAFPVSENIPVGREMQADYRAQVEAAFFKNVLNLPVAAPNMTATEVLERKDEFIRTIGPVFGRLETDYIGHIVERVFGIMERANAFPPRPDVLLNVKITFTFQSPIQQARRQIEIAGFSRAMEMLNPLIAIQPEIMDNFDGDEIARDAPEWSGMTPRWIRTLEEVQKRRGEKQAQQTDQNTVASLPNVTRGIKDVAQAQQLAAQAGQQGIPGQPGLPAGQPGIPMAA